MYGHSLYLCYNLWVKPKVYHGRSMVNFIDFTTFNHFKQKQSTIAIINQIYTYKRVNTELNTFAKMINRILELVIKIEIKFV
jgi:hypothetical protein